MTFSCRTSSGLHYEKILLLGTASFRGDYHTVQLHEPDTEDWGWYTTINWRGRSYLLGASASESDSSDYEWVFQVDKHRTFTEKLLGKAKMAKNDECLLFFKSVFDAEPEFKNVVIE